MPERPGPLKGPDLKQIPATAPQPPPRPQVERKPAPGRDAAARKAGESKRQDEGEKAQAEEGPAAEQEESKDVDKEAAPCQVLFVLRVVEPGDMATAASVRARAANVMPTEVAKPPAAEADAARQAAPAGKR